MKFCEYCESGITHWPGCPAAPDDDSEAKEALAREKADIDYDLWTNEGIGGRWNGIGH